MKTLIFWQLRQIRFANLIAVAVTTMYFLMNQTPMRIPGTFVMLLGALLHSGFMTYRLCRSSRENAFLHVQSFSRGQIWWATWIALFVSGLSVAVTCGLVVWSGLRSHVQDTVVGNPWYVIPNLDENWLPITLFVHYSVLISLLLYCRIRVLRPFDDPAAGWTLMCFGIACYVKIFSAVQSASQDDRHLAMITLAYVPLFFLLVRNSVKGARTTEVNS